MPSLKRLFRKKYQWSDEDANQGIVRKVYKSYSEYLAHQKSKFKIIEKKRKKRKGPSEYDIKFRSELRKRLEEQGIVQSGMDVLCLGARVGTEVKAFLDLNCFAVGIDVSPGEENKYVVYGDFQDIQFPDHCVDIVFSNSLDHAFDIDKVIGEIKRVLKPDGFLILEIFDGWKSRGTGGYYEAFAWMEVDDVLDFFLKSGFELSGRVDFSYPWQGQHVTMSVKGHDK